MSVRRIVPIQEAEWHLYDSPDWVVAREPDWTFEAPEHAAVAFLLIDEQHHVATQSYYCRTVRKLLTIAAVQSLGQVELEFDPAAHRLLLHGLTVWRTQADGSWESRSWTDRDAFLLRQREQQLEQQMLNGRVSLVALLEDVRVGDIIDLAWSLEPRDLLPNLRFGVFYGFGWTVSVGRAAFTVHCSETESTPDVTHSTKNAPQPTVVRKDHSVTWTVERPEPIVPEPNTPGTHWPVTLVDVSGWKSWAEVAEFCCALWKDALSHDSETIAAEANRLRNIAPEDQHAAVRAAIRFVQEEVRYLANDLGHGGGLLPNGAGTVLRRRFGDCKDKSVLLCALIRALGVDASPTLVASNWRHSVGRVQPSTAAFSHAIVAIHVDGTDVFVDPTWLGQGGSLKTMIAPDYGLGLILRPGTTKLAGLPALPETALTLCETFYLDRKQREGRIEQSLQAEGWFADNIRATLLRDGEGAFFRNRAESLQRHFPTATARQESAAVVESPEKNSIEVRMTYALPTWGQKGEKPPPMFRYGAHGLSLGIEALEGPQTRLYAWALPYPLSITHRVVVRGMCVGKVKSEKHRVSGPGFNYSCDVRPGSREVTFDYKWATTSAEIAAEKWPEYCRQREKAFDAAGANVPIAQGAFSGGAQLNRWWLGLAAIVVLNAVRLIHREPSGSYSEPARSASGHRESGVATQTDLTGLRKDSGQSFRMHITAADALMRQGQYDEAASALDRARTQKPEDPDVEALTALLHLYRGNHSGARFLYRKILERNPEDLRANVGLAETLGAMSDWSGARIAWERALQIKPGDMGLSIGLATALWAAGDHTTADNLVMRLDSSNPASRPATARYYINTGRPNAARVPAEMAVRQSPDDPQLVALYADALIFSQDPGSALGFLQRVANGFEDREVWRCYSIAAALSKDTREAERAFTKWRQLAPNDPTMLANYGWYLHASQKSAEARDLLEKAVAGHPNNGLLWLNYSNILEALGDPRSVEARERADRLSSGAKTHLMIR